MDRKIEKKFIRTYDTHFEKVFKYCYYRTNDRDLAKDLGQQTFMKVWKSLSNGSEIENLKAFVYATAHNLVVDWYRKKKEISLDVMEENGFDPPDTGHCPEHDAEVRCLLEIMNELSPEEKDLVLMRHVEGMKPRDIALLMSKDTNTISVRIHRATAKLREILKKKNI